MNLLVVWLIIGFISSLIGIITFRRDGTTIKKGELYLALFGPLFGIIVTIMLIIDLFRIRK